MQINQDPVRYALSRSEGKKGLFSKKEVLKYALGDENRNPLTPFEYDSLRTLKEGYFCASVNKGRNSVLLDVNGKEVLKALREKGYEIMPEKEYYLIRHSLRINKGMANMEEKILIDPEKNTHLEVLDDIVLYGNMSPVTPENNQLGAGRLVNGELVPVVRPEYSFLAYVGGRVIAAGRVVVTTTRQVNTLMTDKVTKTARAAFQLYSVDTGLLHGNKVFGDIHQTKKGNYSAVLYPKIRPEDLLHKQTMSEAFSGGGLLDFTGGKQIVLNENFEFPK